MTRAAGRAVRDERVRASARRWRHRNRAAVRRSGAGSGVSPVGADRLGQTPARSGLKVPAECQPLGNGRTGAVVPLTTSSGSKSNSSAGGIDPAIWATNDSITARPIGSMG